MSVSPSAVSRQILEQLASGWLSEDLLASLAEQLSRCFPRGHVTIRLAAGEAGRNQVLHASSRCQDVYAALHLAAPGAVGGCAAARGRGAVAVTRWEAATPSGWAEIRGAAECFDLRVVSVAPIVVGSAEAVGAVVISEAGDLLAAEESLEIAAVGARLASMILRREGSAAIARQGLLSGHFTGGRAAPRAALPPAVCGVATDASRVLVVEDDVAVGTIMKRLLVRDGHEAEVVVDPFEALKRIESAQDSYDLCFFDYTMPGLDGLALARRLRAAGIEVPIVMISGMGEAHMRQAQGAEMVDAFVSKPFTSTGLRDAIGEAQQRRAAS